MTDRELMQQALDALEEACEIVGNAWAWRDEKGRAASNALRARLAQPEPEPVAIVDVSDGRPFVCVHDQTLKAGTPLYTNQHSANRSADSAESFCKPEPVAWMYVNEDGECEQIEYGEPFDDPSVTPLYTAPPQREWHGLTDEQRNYLAWESNNGLHCVTMTEAMLREKNA